MKNIYFTLLFLLCFGLPLSAAANGGGMSKSSSLTRIGSIFKKKKKLPSGLKSYSEPDFKTSPLGETVYSKNRRWSATLKDRTLIIMYFENGIDLYGQILTYKAEGVGEGGPAVLQLEIAPDEDNGVETLYVIVNSLCRFQAPVSEILSAMRGN